MKQEVRERLIFALDVDEFSVAEKWVQQLHENVGLFKVGKQLFTRCGPAVIEMIQKHGSDVFLDLKYHDIPNTVAKAAVEACKLGVKIFNVHALGGAEMMRKTVAEVDAYCAATKASKPQLLAVTTVSYTHLTLPTICSV